MYMKVRGMSARRKGIFAVVFAAALALLSFSVRSEDYNPTLVVNVASGERALDAAEIKSWTTRIVKSGEGTLVVSPVTSESVTNLTVEGGTVKLSPSAPESTATMIGEIVFAPGARLDLSGKSYTARNLRGSPEVLDAATFGIAGLWHVESESVMNVHGTLSFGEDACVAVADKDLFESLERDGEPIAIAAAGIEGNPAIANYEFDLKLSQRIDLRGRSCLVANLMGSPEVVNAVEFRVAGLWTVDEVKAMTVDGVLRFEDDARVVLADESLFASVGREGVVIATAAGGIVGLPAIESYDFILKLSDDGKSLIVCDNIPDEISWRLFTRKVTVTFGGAQSGAALANFPALVRLSEDIPGFSYADFTRKDGVEIRFADANGNLIPHEIDTWDTNGTSTVWVKVPALAKNATVTAYYGCKRPGRARPAKEVWDDDYVGVWHLGERALPLKESSETSSDFKTSKGDTIGFAAPGIVGGSVDFPTNGLYNSLVAPDHDALDGFSKFTIEVWTFQDEHKSNAGILSKRKAYNSEVAYYLFGAMSSSSTLTVPICVGTNRNAGTDWTYHQARAFGEWNHLVYSIDMTTSTSNVHGFRNGAMNGWVPSRKFLGPMPNCASDLCLGNLGVNGKDTSFNGRIDEVRISKTTRSAEWIKATYETVANPTFATYAVERIEPQFAFAKEVLVAFGGYSGGAALTDFPVLVRLSENIPGFSYADFRLPNGGDLRFYGADGHMLVHEIDTWNECGVSTVWVKVPTFSASASITAKYGCTDELPEMAAKDVWDDDYVGVWHLGERALPLKESSETSSDFESSNGDSIGFAAPGVVGGAVDFPTNGIYNALVAPDHDALDGFSKFTIEVWTFQNEHKSNAGILSKRKSDRSEMAYYLFGSSSSTVKTVPLCVGTNRNAAADWSIHQRQTLGAWNHLAYSVDMTTSTSNVHQFKDGVMNGWVPSKKYLDTMPNCASDLCLGNLGAKGRDSHFNGRIDEVRISRTTRSAAWIKATYETVMKLDFATYSTVSGTLSGFAAWMNSKELAGGFDEADAKGVLNGVRYAFDIDPMKDNTAEIGDPIIKVVFDTNGNPVVEARALAAGRDDIAFGILATENLSDWSNAMLVPMKRFTTDGFWKPSASENNSSYVFPPQMFFRYTVEIK